MIIVATQIREGMILNLENELYRVTWTMHRTPGKGNAVMQTKLKNIISGKNLEKRFMSNEKVDKAELMTHDMQFLYEDPGQGLVFMNNTDYEQIILPKDMAGAAVQFLVEGDAYLVSFFGETPVGLEMPTSVTVKIAMAPPDVKRATATNSLRSVETDKGLTVQAPSFIKEGDLIKINTETLAYIERVSG